MALVTAFPILNLLYFVAKRDGASNSAPDTYLLCFLEIRDGASNRSPDTYFIVFFFRKKR